MSRLRLIADAAKSPTMLITAPTPQMTAVTQAMLLSGKASSTNQRPYSQPISAAPATPPMQPSSDFFGLNTGKIFFLPISFPTA